MWSPDGIPLVIVQLAPPFTDFMIPRRLATNGRVMVRIWRKFEPDKSGVTAVEYGLIAALIGVAVAVVAGTVGDKIVDTFNEVVTKLGGEGGGGASTE